MSTNLTVEAPNFERIKTESGQFTSDAINLIWSALNDTRASQRRGDRLVDALIVTLAPTSNTDDLDLGTQGRWVILSFTGASSVNLTGLKAPSTNNPQTVLIQVSGAGTITIKNATTSQAGNQIVTAGAADVALATNKGMLLTYLASRWREVTH